MENKFTKLCQVGIVVRDREETIKNMRDVFGVEPDMITKTTADENSTYYGEQADYEAELLFYRFAGVEIEFMVPLRGKSIWQDYLDEHGEGVIHHVLFNVDNYEDAKAQMAEHGIKLMQEGASTLQAGARWGYFDTGKKLPFIIEMKNIDELEKKNQN